MNEATTFLFGYFLGIVMGVFAAALYVDTGWEKDCTKVGAHRAEGKVYDCKPRAQ